MLDQRGRPLRDLRISVTDSCNFRCTYCMPAEMFPLDYPFLKTDQLLNFDEIARVVEAAVPLGLKKVKLTGGEPLLRSLLPELIHTLKTRFDVEVGLITNGLHLPPVLSRLRDAGLDGVTVSIDALNPDVFGRLTGNGHRVEAVLDAIEQTREIFGSVKLNAVLLRGENDSEALPLAAHFRRPGFTLRFIEFMDVGTLNRWNRDRVVTGDEVKTSLAALGGMIPREKSHPGETSETWDWSDGNGSVGFINSISRPFCGTCSRARLGPDGQLYTCLFSSSGFDLKTPLRAGASPTELTSRLTAIWTGRSDRYSELRSATTSPEKAGEKKVEMFAVGG